MKDHSHLAVIEAAALEMTSQLIDVIKSSDADIIKNRLFYIVTSSSTDASFFEIAGRLIVLHGTKTSGDKEI